LPYPNYVDTNFEPVFSRLGVYSRNSVIIVLEKTEREQCSIGIAQADFFETWAWQPILAAVSPRGNHRRQPSRDPELWRMATPDSESTPGASGKNTPCHRW